MADWKTGDADRRSHAGNPGLSGEVGELRATLQMFITQQVQSWASFHDELKDQREKQAEQFTALTTKLDDVISWRNQMTGGMRVAGALWKAWAVGVTLILGWLGYMKGAH